MARVRARSTWVDDKPQGGDPRGKIPYLRGLKPRVLLEFDVRLNRLRKRPWKREFDYWLLQGLKPTLI